MRVIVFSPGKDTVQLGLNIFHDRSTNYNTRIEHLITLKPGKNEVTITKQTLAGSITGLVDGRTVLGIKISQKTAFFRDRDRKMVAA